MKGTQQKYSNEKFQPNLPLTTDLYPAGTTEANEGLVQVVHPVDKKTSLKPFPRLDNTYLRYESVSLGQIQDILSDPDLGSFNPGWVYAIQDSSYGGLMLVQAISPRTLDLLRTYHVTTEQNQDGTTSYVYQLGKYDPLNDVYDSYDDNPQNYANLHTSNTFDNGVQTFQYYDYRIYTEGMNLVWQYNDPNSGNVYTGRIRLDDQTGKLAIDTDYGVQVQSSVTVQNLGDAHTVTVNSYGVTVDSPDDQVSSFLSKEGVDLYDNNSGSYAGIRASRDTNNPNAYNLTLNGGHVKSVGVITDPDDVITLDYFQNNASQVDDSQFVHKTLDEVIAGIKDFVDQANFQQGFTIRDPNNPTQYSQTAPFLWSMFNSYQNQSSEWVIDEFRFLRNNVIKASVKYTGSVMKLTSDIIEVSQAPTTNLGIANKGYVDTAISGVPKTTIAQFPVYTASTAGVQTVTITGISGIITVQVLQPNGNVRTLWLGNLTVTANTLTISADELIIAGDKITGSYYK